MRPIASLLGAITLTATLGAAPRVEKIAFPYGESTQSPHITTQENGDFVVSWVDRKAATLNYARYRDGRWTVPRMFEADRIAVNKANDSSVRATAKSLFAQWIVRKGSHGSAIWLARSADGRKWSAPRSPHVALESEFGFVSQAASGDGNIHFVWLDGRKLEGGEEGKGDMELRAGVLAPDGRIVRTTVVDPRVCDCCQTAMAMTPSGPIVAYRDRSANEIRDIAVSRWTRSGWSTTRIVHPDGWQMPGCPVNGPRLDADKRHVALVWFTAAKNQPRVYLSTSNDGGATFAPPVRVDEGKPLGRVDTVLLSDGTAVVSWVELVGTGAAVMARIVGKGGPQPAMRLAEVTSGSVAGFPRMAASRDVVLIGWSDEKSVALAMLMGLTGQE